MPAKDMSVAVKGSVRLEISGPEIDGFSNEVYDQIFQWGMEVALKKGMTKIGKDDKGAIEAKARENLENLKQGKLKASRSRKAKGVSGAVMTEARRLALNWFKQECKRQGIKFAHVDAKDRSEIINGLLEGEAGPGLIAKAEENLALASKPDLFTGHITIPTSERKVQIAQGKAERAAANKAAKERTPLTPGAIPKRGDRPTARV